MDDGLLALAPRGRHGGGAGRSRRRREGLCQVQGVPRPGLDTNRIGLHLGDVIGRTAGSVEGFKYSDAMKAKGEEGLVWNDETLAAYLADPKGYIPKNKMAFPGLKKEDDVANVIAYLHQAEAARPTDLAAPGAAVTRGA